MMRRRDLLAGAAGFLAAPAGSQAQAGRTWRIGNLSLISGTLASRVARADHVLD